MTIFNAHTVLNLPVFGCVRQKVIYNLHFLIEHSKTRRIGSQKFDLVESVGNNERVVQLEERKKRFRQMLADSQIEVSEYESDIQGINAELLNLTSQKTNKRDWHKIAEDIIDLTTEIVETMNNGLVKDKRSMFTKLGSNLIWNEEILSIINTEPIQKLVDGLNEARAKNPKFEPENIVDTSEQNAVFRDVIPIMLAGGSGFRTNY